MNHPQITRWSVFTKPWPDLEASQLAALVRGMGFDGIELPVRDGFQVQPGDAGEKLGKFVRIFADEGVTIESVAAAPTEDLFDTCAENGVRFIRIMVPVVPEGFVATGRAIRAELDELASLSQKYPVRALVQPHYGYYVSNSVDLASLLTDYDPQCVGAIWDAAHEALAGRDPEHGLEALWPWLALVNLKNAYYRRSDAGSPSRRWERYFTDGQDGMAPWDRAARYLTEHQFDGPICLTAEYTDETDLESRVTNDLKYARSIFEGGSR